MYLHIWPYIYYISYDGVIVYCYSIVILLKSVFDLDCGGRLIVICVDELGR
jgi:hypothetical protein